MAQKKESMFRGVPVNFILIPLALVFAMHAGLIMYYNGALIFTGIESYFSLHRASEIAAANFTDLAAKAPLKKEMNGYLYPLIVSLIAKAGGSANLVMILYILGLGVFGFTSALFYRAADRLMGGTAAFAALLVYMTAAPVILAHFSGGDVLLLFALFALNAYHAFFSVPAGRYKGIIITAVLMALVSMPGAVYALASLVYAAAHARKKRFAKAYAAQWGIHLGVFILPALAILSYTFIDRWNAEFFSASALVNTKTFMVDTFFKDGFLWSKTLPFFFAVFFYITLFVKAADDIKARRVSFITYCLFMTAAALLLGFFAMLPASTDTLYFMAPFYFIIVLIGAAGIKEFAGYMNLQGKTVFTREHILYGLLVFMLMYNVLFSFAKITERAAAARHIAGHEYVQKFIER
ncbi:MAG TPA: hypothetical protein ENN43_08420 [bacterium]|nr:hypothetical protein [bacterium]